MLQLDAGEVTAGAAEARALPAASVRYYVLVVLAFVAAVNALDRQIVNIMVEPIRLELKLSDGEMGLLTGFAFALVYATLCIPAARLADRGSRRWIMAGAIGIWSLMTIACGFAQNTAQLFLARFGVGFGEAGGTAPAQSFLGDLFPRDRRATVMSVLMIAPPLGVGLGLFLGGLSLHAYGWRTTFMFAGLPGLILTPLVLFTFPKVPRGLADGVVVGASQESFLTTMRQLFAVKSQPFLMLGATLGALVGGGMNNWVPAFLERSHGLDRAAIGASLGAALGGGALIGSLCGGPMYDWFARRDLRWQFWLPICTSLIQGAAAALAMVAPLPLVFPLLALQVGIGSTFSGPMIAISMNLAPVTARATVLACLFFAINAFGLGTGPALIGMLSDLLHPAFGTEALRYAMLCATLAALPAAYCFWRASLTYRADIARVDAHNLQG